MNRKAILFPYLCLIALVGCQGARVVQPPPSLDGLQACLDPSVPSEDPQDKQRCVYLIEQFLKAEPDHPSAGDASFRLGQLYLETGDFSAAYHLFQSFLTGKRRLPPYSVTRTSLMRGRLSRCGVSGIAHRKAPSGGFHYVHCLEPVCLSYGWHDR